LKNNQTIRLGTRGSRLALAQAEWVKRSLESAHAEVRVEIVIIKTTGDVLKSAPLSVIGGQGVFTKELEEALLDARVDLAVHSLKDLPSNNPDTLTLAAIPAREDPRDALIMPADSDSINFTSINDLPAAALVGTSSPRRLAQLKHLRPDLRVAELRGNVETRLRKLDAGDYDAIILATAGLNRLDLAARITLAISPEEMLPAVGQAALGLQTRAADGETQQIVRTLDHAPTRAACLAERSLLRHLGGGCQYPIAGFAQVHEREFLRLRGLIAEPNGDRVVRDELTGELGDAEPLGEQLARRMLAGDDAANLLAAHQ
jgi:hydroxymethylbilane synthase